MLPLSSTTTTASPSRSIKRSAVISWVLYDLANTIFSMAIVSLYYSLWLRDQVGKEQVDGLYSVVTAISMLIVFVASPLLGALTDQSRKRMPFLVVSSLICIGFTFVLGRGGLTLSLVAFIIANISYQAGLQFYDALLTEVSTEENRGSISGIGVGVGYLGSYIGVGTGLLVLTVFKQPIELIFPIVAILFLVFALPAFFLVEERINPRARPFSWNSVHRATTQVVETFKHTRNYPGLLRFLLGRMFYTDAINTVISVMGLYVINQVVRFGMRAAQQQGVSGAELETLRLQLEQRGSTDAQVILLGAITFAVLGGFLWGRIVDRIGPRRTLNAVLIMWMFIFVGIILIGLLGLPIWVFYIMAALAGVALGGVWTADRPFMLRLSPPARIGEFYGLYGMVGRFSAITGPLIWGLIVGVIFKGNPDLGQPVAIMILLGLIIISFLILRPVTDEPRNWTAEERGEA